MVYSNFWVGSILLVIGLINLSGKATFLIAGYNTMTREEKAKRNIKAISRFLGEILIVNALNLIIGGILYLSGILSIALHISWVLFIVILIFQIVYLNVGKRFQRH